MTKYLVQGQYSSDAMKGLIKDGGGTARRAAIEKLVQSLGGKLDATYFSFGEADLYLIVDTPDNVAVEAALLTVGATGAANLRATPLLTPEEVDQAVKKTPIYRAPGQ